MAISYQRKLGDGTIVIDSNTGNVGIGTNDPANKLTVYRGGGVRVTGITSGDYIEMSGDLPGYSANQYPVIKSGGTIHFANNNKYSAYIEGNNTYFGILDNTPTTKVLLHTSGNSYLNGGNVGIGTTSPDTLLHIESTSDASSPIFTIENDNDIKLKLGAVRSAAGTAPDTTFIAYDGDLRFIADADSTTEVVRIDSSGNVGIGKTDPSAPLHINGGSTNQVVKIQSTSAPYIRFKEGGTDVGFIQFGTDSYISNQKDGTLNFRTNNTDKMTISSSGMIGIGTTNPLYSLELRNAYSADNVIMGYYDTSDVKKGFIGVVGTAGDFIDDAAVGDFFVRAQQKLHLSSGTTGDYQVTIDTDGSVQFSAYGAGYLKTDADGNISVDTSTIEDTLDSVADRGNSTDQTLIFPQSYKDTDTANVTDDNWYRVIDMGGSAGRGACEFALYSGGGTRSPFSCRGAVTTSYGNSGSTITVYHNGHSSAIKAIRVVRNSGDGNAFVDIKTYTDDGVTVYIEAGAVSTSATTVDFTDVTTLPSGDAVETELDIDGKSFGTTSSSSAGEFSIERDGQIKVHREITLQEDKDNAETVFIRTSSRGGGTNDADIRLGNSNNGIVMTVHNDSVGIGTISPVRPLHIHSTSNTQMQFTDDGTGSNDTDGLRIGWNGSVGQMWLFEDADLRFATNNSEKMRITSGGNVGIGTDSPDGKLTISENGGVPVSLVIDSDADRADTSRYHLLIDAPRGTGEQNGIGFGELDNDYVTAAILARDNGSSAATGLDFATGNSSGVYNRMSITSGGNVGIGTTDPNQLLHTVGGTVKVESDGSNASGAILELKHANNNTTDVCATINFTNNVGGYAAIEGGTTGANNTGYLAFKTDNAGTQGEAVRILGNGNVGIGTTGPSTKLDVDGYARFAKHYREGGFSALGSTVDDWYTIADFSLNSATYTYENFKGTVNWGYGGATSWYAVEFDVYFRGNNSIAADGAYVRWSYRQTGNAEGKGGSAIRIVRSDDVTYEIQISPITNYGVVNWEVLSPKYSSAVSLTTYDTVQTASTALSSSNIVQDSNFYVNGNVGIGTTSPGAELEISKAGSPVFMLTNTSAAQSWIQYVGSNDDFILRDSTDSRTVFRVSGGGDTYFEGGNVGIGTTSPDAHLHVSASSDAHLLIESDNTMSFYQDAAWSSTMMFGAKWNGTNQVYGATTRGAFKMVALHDGDTSPQYLAIYGANHGTAGGTVTWNTVGFAQDEDGNVGIGTTNPSKKLDVRGEVALDIMPAFQQAGSIRIGRSDGTSRYHEIVAYNDSTTENNYIRFDVHNGTVGSNTGALTLRGNGNVQFPQYGAGYLQTDASGNITAGTVTTSDTLDDVTDNGNSTTNSIVLGASTTGGTMLVRGTYTSGNIVVIGGMKSSGGAMIGYGVKPDTATNHGFVSSSAFTLERSAYYQQGNRHRWYAGASQDVAIGNAVTMSETMRLDFDKLGLSTSSPASLIHLGKPTNGSNIITFGEASIGGPHGLDFYGDDATRTKKYSIYYRTGTENISMETSDGTKRFEINQSGAVTLNEAFTFPTADGSAGAALVTNGSGSLSWNAGYQQYTPVGWGVLNNQTYTSTGSNISSNSTQAQAGTTPVQRNSATEFEATKAGWYEISYSFIVKNNYTNRAMIGAYMTASSSGGGGVIPGSHSTQYVRYSTYGEYAQIQNTFYYYTSYSSTNFYLLAYLLSGSMNMTTQAVSQSMISFRYINNDIT